MNFVERYYIINRLMMTSIGLWPYQKKNVSRILGICVCSTLLCFIVFQLTTFATRSIDVDYVIKEFSYIFPTCVYSLSYNSFYFNMQSVKNLMEHVKADWIFFTEDYEIKIMKKYSYQGYMFTLLTCGTVFFLFFGYILLEFMPIVLDIVKPLNESRPRNVKVPLEFFIFNEQDHFIVYLAFDLLAMLFSIVALLSIGAMMYILGRHFCATYKIASILLENIVTEQVMQIPPSQRIYLMYQKIHRAVTIHRRSVKFINDQVHTFHMWFFPLIIAGAVSLSCVFFRVVNVVTRCDIFHNENDFYEFFLSSVLLTGHIVYMFVANLSAQSLLDHSVEVWEANSRTLWYMAPLSIQKMILFMQTSIKDHKLVIGGLFAPCLEGFATLFTSAISYFTVIYALRG